MLPMNENFTGRTAIVTGAAVGIGYGIAEHFVRHGATVVVNDIDAVATQEAVTSLNELGTGGRAHACAGDASDVSFIREMTDYAAGLEGSELRIAVANAGLTEFGDFLKFTEESFDRVVDLNLKGTFFLAQSVARHIVEQGGGGRLILIGSNVGELAYPDLAAYGMSKGGIAKLVRHLSYDLGPRGITVNYVAPGATLTARTELEEPDYAGIWAKLNPNGRVGYPADVAAAVGFLCSEAASHINGQELFIDGGWTGYGPSPAFVREVLDGEKQG